MENFTVRLGGDELEEIRDVAAGLDRPVAYVVRLALRDWLQRHVPRDPGFDLAAQDDR